jgi:3-carboxy-cis,cis-muconate cycloisomerase
MTFSALDSTMLGPLFAGDDMRAVFSDRARLQAMLRVEAALAWAQSRFGMVPEELAAAIKAVRVEKLDVAEIGTQTILAAVPTIPFVKAVQAKLPKELEPWFHKGATTQDIVDTALVLQMRDAFALIARELDPILAGLAGLATEHRDTPCVGRTYGQHAAPVTFGYKIAVWANGIAEVASQLPWLRERALVASLGGPVGTLASAGAQGPAVVEVFAQELGLGTTPLTWHTLRARMVETGVWLATLMGALAKMATDVVHLASTEVGEVAEPYVLGRGGSSAMPHKRNPVSATVILAAHAASKGHVATLLDAMAAAHERPAGPWHAEWQALPQLFGLISGSLREARTLANGLMVERTRMRQNLDATRGLLFADAVAAQLAPALGRLRAHRLVEQAADKVRTSGAPLRDVLSSDPAFAADVPYDALDAAFDLSPSIEAAAVWVDRAVAEVARVRTRLAVTAQTSPER